MEQASSKHPLLIRGDAVAGSFVVSVMYAVVYKADQRKARGFTDQILKEIAEGSRPVSEEAIRQLITDHYTSSFARKEVDSYLKWLVKIAPDVEAKAEVAPPSPPITPRKPIQLAVSSRGPMLRATVIRREVADLPVPQIETPRLPRIAPKQTKAKAVVWVPKTVPAAAPPHIVPPPIEPVVTIAKDPVSVNSLTPKQQSKHESGINDVISDRPSKVVIELDAAQRELFFKNLEKICAAKRVTSAQLLAKMEMPETFFLGLQSGTSRFLIAQVPRFASALGVSSTLLFGE